MTAGNDTVFSLDKPVQFGVSAAYSGMRLDAVLAVAFPDLGLRARRRLWDWCTVTVNGKKRAPGVCVIEGDVVVVAPPVREVGRSVDKVVAGGSGVISDGNEEGPGGRENLHPGEDGLCAEVCVVAASPEYIAFYKPSGLHSACIRGSREASVESLIERDWPLPGVVCASAYGAEKYTPGQIPPHLLTRLDGPTSGILLAVRDKSLEKQFRSLEAAGQVKKEYVALVRGSLHHEIMIKNRLQTSNRAKTGVSWEMDTDPVRHTHIFPICSGRLETGGQEGGGGDATLVRAMIYRGARHQIRAHLAHAGYPLVGDILYGSPDRLPPSGETLCMEGAVIALNPAQMYLHHGNLDMPGFRAVCSPRWEEKLCALLLARNLFLL